MDQALSSPHRGGRQVRWLIRRWLVPPLMAWSALAAMAVPAAVHSRPGGAHDRDLAVVRGILMLPESDIDLATAKLTIDRLIEPSIDVPYHYDLDDPLGRNLRNKLLPVYLETRAGNCVSMPLLFVVLGQKLGIDLSIATSPNHVFVKYRDDRGEWFNIETTSGAGFSRDVWMRQQFPMTDEAIASGLYMRPLSRKETVVVMVGTLLEFYERQGLRELQLKMSRMALDHNPRDVAIILHQHAAWLWFRNLLVNRYVTPDDMPAAERALLVRYEAALRVLFQRAWLLGWRPADAAHGAHGLHAQWQREVHLVGQFCFGQQQRGRVQEQCELRKHAKCRADSERLLAVERRAKRQAGRTNAGAVASTGIATVWANPISNPQLPESFRAFFDSALLLGRMRDGDRKHDLGVEQSD